SISLMRKAMDKARKENAKDPFPEAFEDYQLFAYTYVNDKGETVTMWLLERNGKRASNKELQVFLEENGAELDPILYTNLSGEELERKVNDAWKDGVNYLNGQKVTGFSGATLRSAAYVASVKDAMDDAGLSEMALGLGFGIAAARNKAVIPKKQDDLKVSNFNKEQILKNIEASKKARGASNFSEYLKREKEVLERIKKANGEETFKIPKATELVMTETVNTHILEIIKRGVNAGELSRPYIDSDGTELLVQEIMDSRMPIKDIYLPNGLRWDVSGSFNGRGQGNWELVVDLDTNKIVHFNFTK
ncbi:hypothetical protein A7N88_11165, partial [Listeria monocytogenes]